ncbi:ABC transporter ATP-binding protein [Thermocoleostomius sinensis]|uniref:ABC transporter ATP-binding protein n=1 Tax=Thermocoleostomius sinensis A174 TaxID=2016057 RepID=A0A9E8ZB20_9CYAN|nr:ABC transporter ATP-binding protein [Thermocoleostomius sinensis]WAL59556.1 ABC transporter ATP-binding protein [Thermocoleostomius sinensis A174]
MNDTILDVRNLQVEFQTSECVINAVDTISFQVQRGQTLGIVGESGSGKSVTSLAVMGLIPYPGRVTGGEIWFQSRDTDTQPVDLLRLSKPQMQQYRGGQVAMIFQEPLSSLNPVYTCGFQIIEAIRQHEPTIAPAEARRRAINLLQEVKLLPSDAELQEHCLEQWRKTNPDAVLPDRDLARQIGQHKHAILDRYPHELSGGQIQRVMIAMAICSNPSLLIADEPTTALDVTVQSKILDLLRELRDRRGMSMMFITHDLGIIAEIADWVAVMYKGKIVEYGSVWDIFSNPQHPYTKGLLACRPQPDRPLKYLPTVSDFMSVTTTPDGELVIQEKPLTLEQAFSSHADESIDPTDAVSTHRIGNGSIGQSTQPYGGVANYQADNLAENRLPTELQPTELHQSPSLHSPIHPTQDSNHPVELERSPILTVEDLQVSYPVRGMFGQTQRYIMAVNGVSFEVYPGETLGLVGESGCGKSTLVRTLLRLNKPARGRIVFEGVDVCCLNRHQLRKLRREMQIIFQDPFSSLDPRMTIGEAIMEPLRIHNCGGNRRARLERVSYLLDRVGIDPSCSNRYPHEFSGGQRQRICIARALALNPKFIICDESVSALDVSVQAQVLNLLKELQDEFNLTYIFISHDLSVVKFMSDRIMVMNRGKIEEIGPAERIYREPQQAYTQQLIAAIPTGSLQAIRDRQLQRGFAVS